MADKLKQLAEFGSNPLWALKAPADSTTDPLSIGKGIRSETILLFSAFDEATAGIKNSVQLTAVGKKDGLTALGEPTIENTEKLRHRLAPVEKALGEAIGKARKETKSTEELIAGQFLQQQNYELLREQVGNDKNALRIAYRDALEAKDFSVCDAIEKSSRLWEARPDADELASWQAERLEAEQPELSEEVRDLTDCLADCVAILDSVEGTIRDVSGLPSDDGIEALANAE